MIVRPMGANDLDLVLGMHEGLPRAPQWYICYPTLVAEDEGEVVGFTSFSVSPNPYGVTTCYGQDVQVVPWKRGLGIGRALCDSRLTFARAAGARFFLGLTQPDNTAMVKILTQQGFHACQSTPAGLLFSGALGDF